MLHEVLETLCPQDGGVYVDGTFGAGGYTRAILGAADCRAVAIDRDDDAAGRAEAFREEFGPRFTFLPGCFGDVEALLEEAEIGPVDGFVLDLGVSSFQLDEAERGFSFRFDGPLDMRMGRSAELSAADIVNTYPQEEIARILYEYGEERHSRRIAKKIVERRAERQFKTTFDLAELIRACLPKSHKDKSDPATRSFQALRIAVNDELGELERALQAALNILKAGGRLVVVTFHSLEDRIVKNFLREKAGRTPSASRHMPIVQAADAPKLEIITRKAVEASAEEIASNPRARSAKLRAARILPQGGGGG